MTADPAEVWSEDDGDAVLDLRGWRASFIRKPPAPSAAGPLWSFGAQHKPGPLIQSADRGIFLDHEPTREEIRAFLLECEAAPTAPRQRRAERRREAKKARRPQR